MYFWYICSAGKLLCFGKTKLNQTAFLSKQKPFILGNTKRWLCVCRNVGKLRRKIHLKRNFF